ncbi:MAG: DUF192 domain-containing protein, partial [Eggerthellaceae bacterium]|nr:DUF192 domain-containing protein [Eggerthellaceae bacterium]
LRSVPQRLRGLLFSSPTKDIALFVPCHDIHTFGMRYPIDVAFFDDQGMVVAAYRNDGSRCRIRCSAAAAAAERASDSRDNWFVVGAVPGAQVRNALKRGKAPRERNKQ